MAKLQTVFEQKDGYQIEVKINTILTGMGFQEKDNDTIISTLSGGGGLLRAVLRILRGGARRVLQHG